MISLLGVAVSGDRHLLEVYGRVLETLAKNQSRHGHIPSLVHDPENRGASDTTPLFLMAVGIYRKATGEREFLRQAVDKALTWMEYQSPSDRYLVAQQPTSDWRDEQWVMGYGLFVNTVVYSYLRLMGQHIRADQFRLAMARHVVSVGRMKRHVNEGLGIARGPYFALWSYKIYNSDRFDLLGNSLAILSGMASPSRGRRIVAWVEAECVHMRREGGLAVDLPPNCFRFIQPGDSDWRPRYAEFNRPGEYHNGGIWPFVCAFYVAALVAAERFALAEEKLMALTELVSNSRKADLQYGFNEWHKAQDGQPMGEDWQTWSAALYLYAAKCVEQMRTPFFDAMRRRRS